MSDTDADVAVVGGGPAGSTAANRLARLGYRVQLFEASPLHDRCCSQSLSGDIRPLLCELGICHPTDLSGVLRPCRSVVLWAGELRTRPKSIDGFQVDRGEFDALLLNVARRAGARVAQPARVLTATQLATQSWRLVVIEGGEERALRCRFLIDATGRHSCLVRRRRRRRTQPATIALCANWRDTQSALAIKTCETIIEAGADQWYWAAPLRDGSIDITVFVDPHRCRSTGFFDVAGFYVRLLRESTLLSGCFSGRMARPVRACAANASRCENPIGTDWIQIGEAALAIDPLSSQGVRSAIMGGLQAAAVVNTLLSDPDQASAAITFYEGRVAAAAEEHAVTAARLYARQALVNKTEFWNARASAPLNSNHAQLLVTGGPAPLAPKMLLEVNPSATRHRIPALLHDRIVIRTAVQLPGRNPVVWAGGFPLEQLLKWPCHRSSAQALIELWSCTFGAEHSMQILRWLYNNGYIVAVTGDSSAAHRHAECEAHRETTSSCEPM